MANPGAVADERGEWIEVANVGRVPVDLRGWTLASGNDAAHRISRSVVVGPGEAAVLARAAGADGNGGAEETYVYGGGVSLANRADWIALRAPDGTTVDSVGWDGATKGRSWELRDAASADRARIPGRAWALAEETFGEGDRGTPGRWASAGGIAPDAARADDRASAGEAPAPVYRDHVAFGIPRDGTPGDDHLIRRPQYVVSYNPELGAPNWVSWNLNATHFGDAPRSPSFQADTSLPTHFRRVLPSDYTGTGYTRGHVVRSEERTATAAENAATFLMTNVLPQHRDLNAGPWLDLERHLQRLAQEGGRELYVVAGGVWPDSAPTLGGRGVVAIPSQTWKVALVLPSGHGLADVETAEDVEVIAVSMPNVAGIASRPWTDYRATVDAVEAATGYDLLDRLPDEVEAEVEARR